MCGYVVRSLTIEDLPEGTLQGVCPLDTAPLEAARQGTGGRGGGTHRLQGGTRVTGEGPLREDMTLPNARSTHQIGDTRLKEGIIREY